MDKNVVKPTKFNINDIVINHKSDHRYHIVGIEKNDQNGNFYYNMDIVGDSNNKFLATKECIWVDERYDLDLVYMRKIKIVNIRRLSVKK
jgi:hypothetical protein